MTKPLVISPWESAISMEAMRMNVGLPVYAASHATHMYGPLLTVALAGVFSLTGLNLLAARAVFAVIGVAIAVVLTAVVARGESRRIFAVTCAMFLAIGWRTNFINFSAQPDAIAALTAICALLLWARGQSAITMATSLLLFIAATFFKQTAAAFAL